MAEIESSFRLVQRQIQKDSLELASEAQKLDKSHKDILRQAQGLEASLLATIGSLPALLHKTKAKLTDTPSTWSWWVGKRKERRADTLSPLQLLVADVSASFRKCHEQAHEIAISAANDKVSAAALVAQAGAKGDECNAMAEDLHKWSTQTGSQLSSVEGSLRESETEQDFHKLLRAMFRWESAERDRRLDRNINIIKYTWYIPGINVLTLPWAGMRAIRHARKSVEAEGAMELTQSALDTEIERHGVLGARGAILQTMLTELAALGESVTDAQAKAASVESQQRKLVDEFGQIAEKTGEIADHLDTMKMELAAAAVNPEHLSLIDARILDLITLTKGPLKLAEDVSAVLSIEL
ncbi:hypothetical protein Q7P37_010958 [Cladosporium fusiforme]